MGQARGAAPQCLHRRRCVSGAARRARRQGGQSVRPAFVVMVVALLAACAGPAAEKQAAGTMPAPAAPAPEPAKEAAPAAPAPVPPTPEVPGDQRDAKIREALRQGEAALAAKDGDGAVRSARQALDADERNVAAMVLLARGYYLKGYDDKVEAVLAIARKHKAGDA